MTTVRRVCTRCQRRRQIVAATYTAGYPATVVDRFCRACWAVFGYPELLKRLKENHDRPRTK